MSNDRETNERLEKQILQLKKEIAELTSLLALKKLETEHPHLEKLVNEISHVRNAVRREAGKIEEFGRDHLGDISLGKSMAVLGGIFLIGSVGYAVLSAFGILGSHKR